ncbi:MAG: hypothetical protein JWN70_2314 [Planctomycetaceae bacterium]|nr:hypothetical protein [Planctomycetaceae bacterium]
MESYVLWNLVLEIALSACMNDCIGFKDLDRKINARHPPFVHWGTGNDLSFDNRRTGHHEPWNIRNELSRTKYERYQNKYNQLGVGLHAISN